MKIALIGDIHANLPALEAILAHAALLDVDGYWNIGDFVGYGPNPDEVVKRVQTTGAVSIVGNYDLKVLAVKDKPPEWRRKKRPEKLLAFEWAYDNLSPEARAYLAELPQEVKLEIEGHSVLLTHGSPASNEEHLTPNTPLERLEELAEMAGTDLIVCGHSHQPFVRPAGAALFVNTGSIGRPDDGDQRASYAVLNVEAGEFKVDHHRIAYDVAAAVNAIRAKGLPEAFAQMLLLGRDFDTTLQHMAGGPA